MTLLISPVLVRSPADMFSTLDLDLDLDSESGPIRSGLKSGSQSVLHPIRPSVDGSGWESGKFGPESGPHPGFVPGRGESPDVVRGVDSCLGFPLLVGR